jgi:phosphate transport system substrate-binding protein
MAAEPLKPGTQEGIDAAIETYTPSSNIEGRVTIAGSETMYPLMKKLVAEFMMMHPKAKFGVEGGGSGRSVREFLLDISFQRRGDKARNVGTDGSSHAELLASSRPLTEQEKKGFASNHGYEPVEIPIAMDAVAIYVNNDNPIQGLTLDQVDGIFSSTNKRNRAGSINSWGHLGLQEAWSQQPIRLIGRSKKSGTYDFFKHVALLDGEPKGSIQEVPGPASEILAIAQDRLAIGYASSGYHTSMVRMLPIAERVGSPYVDPNAQSVHDGSYPLARPLYLYANMDPNGKPDPLVAEFLHFVNSRQGQEVVARANFYSIPATQVAKNRSQLGRYIVAALQPVQ